MIKEGNPETTHMSPYTWAHGFVTGLWVMGLVIFVAVSAVERLIP